MSGPNLYDDSMLQDFREAILQGKLIHPHGIEPGDRVRYTITGTYLPHGEDEQGFLYDARGQFTTVKLAQLVHRPNNQYEYAVEGTVLHVSEGFVAYVTDDNQRVGTRAEWVKKV